jgi:hypothetical protein
VGGPDGEPVNGGQREPSIEITPGVPAWLLALAAPAGAIGLIWYRAAGSGLSAGPDDPIPPVIVAIVTVVVALVVSWRSLSQRARLSPTSLVCRNVLVTYDVPWEAVEALDVVHRPGLVVIDVRIRGLRRRHRLGAATRAPGGDADAVLDLVSAHPVAAGLLRDPERDAP